MNRVLAACAIALALAAAPASAQTPPNGQAVFAQCKSCHSLQKGVTMTGPSLHGMFGRKAGTLPGYTYSPAMKAFGKTWDDATLNAYLEAPLKTVKGTKMAFVGVKDPAKRAALIAYLKTATK